MKKLFDILEFDKIKDIYKLYKNINEKNKLEKNSKTR